MLVFAALPAKRSRRFSSSIPYNEFISAGPPLECGTDSRLAGHVALKRTTGPPGSGRSRIVVVINSRIVGNPETSGKSYALLPKRLSVHD